MFGWWRDFAWIIGWPQNVAYNSFIHGRCRCAATSWIAVHCTASGTCNDGINCHRNIISIPFINQANDRPTDRPNAMESSCWLHSKRLLSRTNSKHLFRFWSIGEQQTAHRMQFFSTQFTFSCDEKAAFLRKLRFHIINHRDAHEFSQVLECELFS